MLHHRFIAFSLAASFFLVAGFARSASAETSYDVTPRPLDWITPGTVVGAEPPAGWTHLVIVSRPRISIGDVDAIPAVAAKYATLLNLTILANAKTEADRWVLDKVAIGLSTDLAGKNTVISSDTQAKLGANLGFIARNVLSENEKFMTQVKQVARSSNMLVFDSRAIILHKGDHRDMVMRHALVVDPKSGGLGTMVWLLDHDGRGQYVVAEPALQFLPPNLQEDREISVKGDKFVLGIPTAEAFAMARIPKGTAIEFTADMAANAAVKSYTADSAKQLEAQLWAALAKAGIK